MKRLLAITVLTFTFALPSHADEPVARRVEIKVTEDGFQPREVQLKKGERVSAVAATLASITEAPAFTN